jgi:phosphate:Na+ symporter
VPLFVEFIEDFTRAIQGSTNIQLQIANSHTIFNIAVALVFLPMNKYFVRLLISIVKEKKPEKEFEVVYIDKLLLDTPSAAIEASLKEIQRAMKTNSSMLNLSVTSIMNNSVDDHVKINEREKFVSCLQKDLTNYMVELSRKSLSASDSVVLPGIIKCANYLERISEHTTTLMKLQETRFEKELLFTSDATDELSQLNQVLLDMSTLASQNIESFNEKTHAKVKELDGQMDYLTAKFTEFHVRRLETGKCTIEASLVYLVMLSSLESIANYLYKISRLSRYELQGKASSTA